MTISIKQTLTSLIGFSALVSVHFSSLGLASPSIKAEWKFIRHVLLTYENEPGVWKITRWVESPTY